MLAHPTEKTTHLSKNDNGNVAQATRDGSMRAKPNSSVDLHLEPEDVRDDFDQQCDGPEDILDFCSKRLSS